MGWGRWHSLPVAAWLVDLPPLHQGAAPIALSDVRPWIVPAGWAVWKPRVARCSASRHMSLVAPWHTRPSLGARGEPPHSRVPTSTEARKSRTGRRSVALRMQRSAVPITRWGMRAPLRGQPHAACACPPRFLRGVDTPALALARAPTAHSNRVTRPVRLREFRANISCGRHINRGTE